MSTWPALTTSPDLTKMLVDVAVDLRLHGGGAAALDGGDVGVGVGHGCERNRRHLHGHGLRRGWRGSGRLAT